MRAEGRRHTPLADLSRAASSASRGRMPRRQRSGQPEGRHRVARGDRAGAGPRPGDARRAVRPRHSRTVRGRPTREPSPCPTNSSDVPRLRRRPGLPPGLPAVLGSGRVLRPGDGPPPPRLRRGEAVRRAAAAVRRASRPGSSASSSTPSSRRRCSRTSRAGLMHAGIFWGFVLLTIGTANIVTGGLIETVLSAPFDGAVWAADLRDAERRRGDRHRLDPVGVLAAARLAAAARLTFNRDALLILGDDRRRRRDGAPRRGLRVRAPTATSRGRSSSAALAGPLRGRCRPGVLEAAFVVLWWAHMALVAAFLVLPAVQQAPPHRDALPEHLVPQARAARRAAGDGPRGARTRRSG